MTEFPIPEDDKAEVTFGVLAGNLGGNVLVELSFIPDTAIGTYYILINYNHRLIQFFYSTLQNYVVKCSFV